LRIFFTFKEKFKENIFPRNIFLDGNEKLYFILLVKIKVFTD